MAPEPRHWTEALPLTVGLFSVLQLSILVSQAPLLVKIPGWFHRIRSKEIGPLWMVLALVLLPPLVFWVGQQLKDRVSRWAMLLALVAVGGGIQHGWAWSEGRGLDGIQDRIVRTGHAEFARVAVEQDLGTVIMDYEGRVQAGDLGKFAHSKPPGTLVAYMVTERLARPFAKDDTQESRLHALQTFAAVTWPFLSMLVVFPLFGLARRIVDEDVAFGGTVLYTTIPSVMLVALHTDQAVFPLLFTGTLWLVAEAAWRDRVWIGGLAGVALYFSTWFSFALILCLPMAVGIAVSILWSETTDPVERRARMGRGALALGVGAVATALLWGLGTSYEVFTRYQEANAHHRAWKKLEDTWYAAVHYGWLGVLEWVLWLGAPAAVTFVQRSVRSVREGIRLQLGGLAPVALGLVCAVGMAAFWGQSKGETARLWLPFVAPLCVLAVDEIRRRGRQWWASLFVGLLVVQGMMVWALKANMDFR